MKMYKIAQNVPEGYVKLRITVGKKGEFKSQFIREGASQCSEGSGEFLEDIMDTQVEGFGDTFKGSDPQKTEEYYEQTRPAIPTGVGVEEEKEKEEEGEGAPMTKRPERQLDMGYGV